MILASEVSENKSLLFKEIFESAIFSYGNLHKQTQLLPVLFVFSQYSVMSKYKKGNFNFKNNDI